jgi:hypothetical protein
LKEVVAPLGKEKKPLSSTTIGQFAPKKIKILIYLFFKTTTMGWMLA